MRDAEDKERQFHFKAPTQPINLALLRNVQQGANIDTQSEETLSELINCKLDDQNLESMSFSDMQALFASFQQAILQQFNKQHTNQTQAENVFTKYINLKDKLANMKAKVAETNEKANSLEIDLRAIESEIELLTEKAQQRIFYKCMFCNNVFRDQAQLDQHLALLHQYEIDNQQDMQANARAMQNPIYEKLDEIHADLRAQGSTNQAQATDIPNEWVQKICQEVNKGLGDGFSQAVAQLKTTSQAETHQKRSDSKQPEQLAQSSMAQESETDHAIEGIKNKIDRIVNWLQFSSQDDRKIEREQEDDKALLKMMQQTLKNNLHKWSENNSIANSGSDQQPTSNILEQPDFLWPEKQQSRGKGQNASITPKEDSSWNSKLEPDQYSDAPFKSRPVSNILETPNQFSGNIDRIAHIGDLESDID